MQLPVDIGAVLKAAFDVDEARREPLCVSVYLDDSAPSDVQAHVRSSFASSSPSARVTLAYLNEGMFVPFVNDDMAVIVAGFDDRVGFYAARLRSAGVPTMVVTTLPTIVSGLAASSGYPIPEGDLAFPERAYGLAALLRGREAPAEAPADRDELLPFTEEAAALLDGRMGGWIIEACSEKRLAFALSFPFVRRTLADEEIDTAAAQNAAVGFLPIIPGADLPVMTLNQAKMVLSIAAAYGEELGTERVKELVAVVAGGLACRGLVRRIGVNTPVVGWVVKAAVGYAGTVAMGRAAVRYYEGAGGFSSLAEALAQARDGAISQAAGAAVDRAKEAAADVWARANDYAAARAAGEAAR